MNAQLHSVFQILRKRVAWLESRVLVFRRPASASHPPSKSIAAVDGRAAVKRLADVLQILALTRPADVLAILSFAARLLVDDSFDGSA